MDCYGSVSTVLMQTACLGAFSSTRHLTPRSRMLLSSEKTASDVQPASRILNNNDNNKKRSDREKDHGAARHITMCEACLLEDSLLSFTDLSNDSFFAACRLADITIA